jgi:endonuclease-3 related protein
VGEESNLITKVYEALLKYYGAQAWWPAEDGFEIMVGAILTQNTAWTNVEKAISALKRQGLCNAQGLSEIELEQLAPLIRSSGYYNQKAKRLQLFARWFLQRGGFTGLSQLDQEELRSNLLALHGIGDETADDIVLYAFHHPSFVIDSYTRRLFSRLGLALEKEKYPVLQQMFHQSLMPDVKLYQQYHALIVSHAKRHCRKKPDCLNCPLGGICEYGE